MDTVLLKSPKYYTNSACFRPCLVRHQVAHDWTKAVE